MREDNDLKIVQMKFLKEVYYFLFYNNKDIIKIFRILWILL